jgi:hypothetical protein
MSTPSYRVLYHLMPFSGPVPRYHDAPGSYHSPTPPVPGDEEELDENDRLDDDQLELDEDEKLDDEDEELEEELSFDDEEDDDQLELEDDPDEIDTVPVATYPAMIQSPGSRSSFNWKWLLSRTKYPS